MIKELNFSLEEYKKRVRALQEQMDKNGIEVSIITDPANMNYLTGFDGWSFYVHQCVIVFVDRESPIWIGRGQDSNAARLTSWLEDASILNYDDDYVQSLIKHPMDFVANVLKGMNYDKKVIGTELDSYYFTAKCQKTIEKNLPNATFKDITNLVNWIRVIKSKREIEYIKKAAVLVENAMKTAHEYIDIGVRQNVAAAKVLYSQIAGIDNIGGDYTAIIPLMPAGIRTSTPHLSWTEDEYKDGDTVILELAGCYRRYHCPLSRTLILGKPKQKLLDLANVVVEGLTNALEFVKPGVTCEEVERVWAKTISKSGFIKDSRIGYSMGLNYPPDWGEHTASFRPGDKTVLKENMTFHMIPGIWLDDCGVDISESFRVTSSGIERFTNYPRMLLQK